MAVAVSRVAGRMSAWLGFSGSRLQDSATAPMAADDPCRPRHGHASSGGGQGPRRLPVCRATLRQRRSGVVIADRNPMFLRGLASVWRVARTKLNVSCQSAFNFSPASRPRRITVSRPYALFPEFGPARHVFASATDAGRAFSMGASGVLPKDGAPQSLVRWLRHVMSRQLLVPLPVRNAHRSPLRRQPEEL